MTTTDTSFAGQLVIDRITLGDDYRFVMHCQDGGYGPLVAEIAVDVVCRETVEGDEPTDAALADAIIAEVSLTKQDALPFAA
jgi:hypothetical protein